MPSFDAPDGVYCTGGKTRTVDDYYSLQDALGIVVFAAGVCDLFEGTAGNEGRSYFYDDGLGIGAYGLPDGADFCFTADGLQNRVA